jgi:hypothetical protein
VHGRDRSKRFGLLQEKPTPENCHAGFFPKPPIFNLSPVTAFPGHLRKLAKPNGFGKPAARREMGRVSSQGAYRRSR